MSWKIEQSRHGDRNDWEITFKDINDVDEDETTSNFFHWRILGGAYRRPTRLPTILILDSVAKIRGGTVQSIHIDNSNRTVEIVDHRDAQARVKLPKDCYDAFVEYIAGLKDSDDPPTNKLTEDEYPRDPNVPLSHDNVSGENSNDPREIPLNLVGGRRRKQTRRKRRTSRIKKSI